MIDRYRPLVFVYGTLKVGGRFHREFFPRGIASRTARTCGKLFELAAGYPAIQIPQTLVLASGTGVEAEDRIRERHARAVLAGRGASRPTDAGSVHGELFRLPSYERLRALDGLEGFVPAGASLFDRVLAPAWPDGDPDPVAAWIYVQADPNGTFLPEGRWSERIGSPRRP